MARRVLTELVNLGDERQGIPDSRRRRTLEDFGTDPGQREAARKVVMRLADARLITTSFDQQNKQETVEIIHDSLIREWGRLRQWLRENREFLVWERKITGWAGAWKETGPEDCMQRDKGMLLRTLNLGEADSWIKKRKKEISPLILEYIRESLGLQEEERSYEEKMKQDNANLLARQSGLVLTGVKLGTSRSLLQSTKLALLSIEQQVTADGVNALRSCLDLLPLPKESVSHDGDIFDVSFSPDGRSMATASYDGTARIWDVTAGIRFGEKFKSLKHGCAVNALAFSPDGQLLATAGDDGKMLIWDSTDFDPKKPCFAMDNHCYVLSVAFSKNGNLLAWTKEFTAKIGELRRDDSGVTLGGPWELERGFAPKDIEVKAVSFSPDGLLLATAWEDGVVRVYNSHSGKFLFPLHPDTSLYSSIQTNNEASEIWPDATFSPDGKSLALAWEKYAILWNIDNRREIRRIEHSNRVHSVAFSLNGKELATAGLDQSVRVWDIVSGEEIARLMHEDIVNSVAFSPVEKHKVATVASKIARLWDIRTFESFSEVNKIEDVDLITFSKDGRLRAKANKGKVIIFDIDFGKDSELFLGKNVNSMSFSQDGSLLATAMDFRVQIWASRSGQRLMTADEENYIYSIDISSDGSQIAVASGNEIILRDIATGNKIASIQEDETIDKILFSPDRTQKILATASCRSVRLYRVTSDSKIETLWGKEFAARTIAFNYNGTQLSIASDCGIISLDIDKKTLKNIRAEGNFFALVMSPNADMPCMAASSGRSIYVWDNEGNELARFDYKSDIRALEFSPDGRQLIITKSDDRTAKVWLWQVKDLISQARNRLPPGFAD
jgi:WD40 repeat protein